MILALRKPLAFIVRDFIDDTSYKLAFALNFTNIFFDLFIFYGISLLVGDAATAHLEVSNGDYFTFALVGVGFNRFFATTLTELRRFIRDAQLNGTLEVLLSTQTNILTTIFSSMLYPIFQIGIQVSVLFLAGFLLFDVNIFWTNLPVALVVLLLSLVSFTSIGLMSAGFIVIVKRGDPVTTIFSLTGRLLSGEMYPVSVLPMWLQFISALLPMTWALRALRLALLQGYSLSQLLPNLLILLIFGLILVPTSIVFFNWAIKRAKRDGSLSQY